jgi:hypothetical protein
MQEKPKRLGMLVPGFQDSPAAGSQLDLLKSYIELRHKTLKASRISCQSYSGYRFETPSAIIDLFEVDWQRSTSLLSSMGWARKLTWGSHLVWSWARAATLRRAKGHKGWYRSLAAAATIMLIWWVTTLVALLASAVDFVRGTLKTFGTSLHTLATPWMANPGRAHLAHASLAFLNFFKGVWPIVTAIFVLLGVSITAAIDVADLFRRYLDDTGGDDGLPTRTTIRSQVTEAVATLADDSYKEVSLIGHSFGVLVVLDAIAEGLSRKVQFISLGGFLGFLAAQRPWAHRRIRDCLRSADLQSWNDYYSFQDLFAAAAPVPGTEPKFRTREVDLQATYWQSQLGKSHTMYFQNDEVQDAILSVAAS